MEEEELAHAQAVKVAVEIIELGPRWVILEGGEPLLRPDIIEIAGLLKSGGINVFIITNGNAFTPEKLEMLAGIPARVLFSIDGADERTHEHIKGGSNLKLAKKWATECAARGLFQGLTTVISRENRNQAIKLIQLAEELGGHEIIFLPLKPFGDDASARAYYQRHALTPSEQADTVKEIYGYSTKLSVFYDEPFLWNLATLHNLKLSQSDSGVTIPEVTGCASSYSLYIQTMGDVRPCMFAPAAFSYGNAATEKLSVIWQRMKESPVLNGWNDQKVRQGACGTCPQFNCCRGCLARTYSLCHDTTSSDPACPVY